MLGLLINRYLEGRDRSVTKGTDPTLAWGTEEYTKKKKLSDAQNTRSEVCELLVTTAGRMFMESKYSRLLSRFTSHIIIQTNKCTTTRYI